MDKQELLDSEGMSLNVCVVLKIIILGIEAGRDDSFPFELSWATSRILLSTYF